MDTDISQCPENSNSTDCLLRTLLQLLVEYRDADNAAIDWDPINFAFTLLIGLVAILFALATVIQAIFAAGKGRRRTGHLAIGKWYVATKREWDWSEMNFRYTVSTPILREESLPSLEEYDKQEHFTDKDTTGKAVQKAVSKFQVFVKKIASCFHPGQDQSSESQPSQSRRPSAAWMQFFEEVGLGELDVEAWGTHTKKVAADYLPDDITAAPAYAQVGAIVAAAAMTGIQKVDVDKQTSRKYPILFGQGFQIDFRQHPVLGVVGAYSRYDETIKESRKLDIEELRTAMKNGRGFVDDHKTMDVSTPSTRRQLIERWSQLGEAHSISCTSCSAAFALKSSAISEAHLPLIIGMFADRPKYIPALFPTATMRTNNCLTTLALSGSYWAEVRLDRFIEPDISGRCGLEKRPRWDGFVWPGDKGWESTMSSEVQGLYHKLKIWRRDLIDPWVRDIEEGGRPRQLQLDMRLEKWSKSRLVEEMEQEAEYKPQEEAERAYLEGLIEREIAKREERTKRRAREEQPRHEDAVRRSQLEEKTAPAEAGGATVQTEGNDQAAKAETLKGAARHSMIAEEAGSPIEMSTTNSDAPGGIPMDSEQETKAEATTGHGLVLQMCLGLLQESALLEKWFSEASSDTLGSLRSLVLEQIKGVDQWLSDKKGIRHRAILLCNTSIVLLRVEQMIGENFFDLSGSEETQGHGVQGGSVEQLRTQSRSRERPEQGIVSRTRFKILQVLRNMVDGPDGKVRGASELKDLLFYRSDFTLLWDRLKAVVVYHSRPELDWKLWDQFEHEKHDEKARGIDDVIIYRCLMMVLLFRTAADSSGMLQSGIWDQVVPII